MHTFRLGQHALAVHVFCSVKLSTHSSGAHIEKGGTKTSAGGAVTSKGCREALRQALDKNVANMTAIGGCPSSILNLCGPSSLVPEVMDYTFFSSIEAGITRKGLNLSPSPSPKPLRRTRSSRRICRKTSKSSFLRTPLQLQMSTNSVNELKRFSPDFLQAE